MRFIECGDYYQVLQCLNGGVNINAQNDSSQTPLHIASFKGVASVVKLLLERDAKIDARDNQDETALHYASYYGHRATAEILLKKGAKINTRGNLGKTALHHAASANNADMTKFLLEAGAKANAKDSFDRTPLFFTDNEEIITLLRNKQIIESVIEDNYDQVLRCLNDGADVNAKNDNKEAILHMASLRGMTSIVKLLLEKGANINIQNNLGRTALHHATSTNNADMVEFLLKAGAKANIKDNNGRKPSSFTENKKIIGLLKNPPARCLSDVMVSCLSTPTSVFCGKYSSFLNSPNMIRYGFSEG